MPRSSLHETSTVPATELEHLKIHFAMAYCQHKQMQGKKSAVYGYANASVAQPTYDDLAEAAIDAFANLVTATSTAVDRIIVDTLTGRQLSGIEGN
jgi:hypothetical protein